jgi:hypothetical protein
MDLLQVVIPKQEYFFILVPGVSPIPILKYLKIEIGFYERVIFKDEKRLVVNAPLITYFVVMDEESKNKLAELFKNTFSSTRCTVHTSAAKIQVGSSGYVFRADITDRPDMKSSFLLSEIHNSIKIEVKLEDTNISLFDNIEDVYEEYTTRWELLDI